MFEQTHHLVSPHGTIDAPVSWHGRSTRKPWEYRVSVCLPHLCTPEPLSVVVELLRLQTIRPYIMIVDTGSPSGICAELETMRADDLEIHYVRGHGYINSSAPVAVAIDLCQALCRSPLLFLTHTDCFPMRRNLLEWLSQICCAGSPVVGYGLSDRSWATDKWENCIGHQCTMLHMPTIWNLGLHWNICHGYTLADWEGKQAHGWPDTETCFSLMLQNAGIEPLLLGREINYKRFTDENVDHARSVTCNKVYGGAVGGVKASTSLDAPMQDARDRIEKWQLDSSRKDTHSS